MRRPALPRRVAAALPAFAVLAACGPRAEPPDAPPGASASVPVMGTVLGVQTWAPDSATARAALAASRAAVFRVDSLMSTYKPGSEVSALNRRAGTGEWTALSPETLEVLEASLEWARESGGAFDPTVGPLMDAWGFHDHDPARPPPVVLDSARALVGFEHVEVDREGGRARLARRGARLDFGAIAKGYALDRALEAATRAGATAALVDLGGNVAAAGSPVDGDDRWVVGVRDPRRTDRLMGTVEVEAGSVSTSGDYEQMFEEGGVRFSHIMDPRTAEPARGTAAVTVTAPEGLLADVLSTVLFVLGPDEGRALLERRFPGGGVTAVWVPDPGPGRTVTPDHLVVVEDPGVPFLPEG